MQSLVRLMAPQTDLQVKWHYRVAEAACHVQSNAFVDDERRRERKQRAVEEVEERHADKQTATQQSHTTTTTINTR